MKKAIGVLLVISLFLAMSACAKTPTWEEQYDLGVRYLSENNYEEAIIAFTAAIEIDPKQALAYVGRGDAYVLSAEADDTLRLAQTDYEQAIELDEMIVGAYLGLANVHITFEEYEEAEEVLNRGVEITGAESLAELLGDVQAVELAGAMSEEQKVLLAVNQYDKDSVLTRWTDYEYNEKGQLVRSAFTYDYGTATTSTTTTSYEYDAEGRLIKVTNDWYSPLEYIYDEQGRLIRWYEAEGSVAEHECIYNADGTLIQETCVYEYGTENYEYHYDENGICTGKTCWVETETDDSYEREYEFDYDAEGRLSRETVISSYYTDYTDYNYDFSPFVLKTFSGDSVESASLALNDIMNHEIISIWLSSDSELEVDQDGYPVEARGRDYRMEFIYGTLNAEPTVITFEGNGGISRVNYYDASGTLKYHENYTYYDNGCLCSTTLYSVSHYYDSDYSAPEYTFLYLYDADGNLAETILDAHTIPDWFNKDTGAVTFYQYDSDGNSEKATIYPKRESIEQEKFGVDSTKTEIIHSDAPIISTDTSNGWASAYLRDVFDDSYVTDMTSCRLIYVDNNSTPELWMDYSYGYAGARVYTVENGTTDYVEIDHGTAYWIEYNNFLQTDGGHMDVYSDMVYQIQNGKFEAIGEGNYGAPDNSHVQIDENGYPIYDYYWNGIKVTQTDYEQYLSSTFDMSKATDINQNIYTYEQCKLLLQSIQK